MQKGKKWQCFTLKWAEATVHLPNMMAVELPCVSSLATLSLMRKIPWNRFSSMASPCRCRARALAGQRAVELHGGCASRDSPANPASSSCWQPVRGHCGARPRPAVPEGWGVQPPAALRRSAAERGPRAASRDPRAGCDGGCLGRVSYA